MTKLNRETVEKMLKESIESRDYFKNRYKEEPTKTNMHYWMLADDTIRNFSAMLEVMDQIGM